MPVAIPPPQSLADLLSDPQRVRDAFELLNKLAAMQVVRKRPAGDPLCA